METVALPVDVTDPSDVRVLTDVTEEDFEPVDVFEIDDELVPVFEPVDVRLSLVDNVDVFDAVLVLVNELLDVDVLLVEVVLEAVSESNIESVGLAERVDVLVDNPV